MTTEKDIANAMLEIPHGFTAGGRHFFIYQPSLGMTYINAQLIADAGINAQLMKEGAVLEAIRVAREKRALCCQLIAYNTCSTREEVQNTPDVMTRAEFFNKRLTEEDIALLFLQVLNQPDPKELMKKLEITKDDQLKKRVQAAKRNESSYTFGGRSVYGTLIGAACEKYGWTYDYCVWGISFINLQLLMADALTSIYLSEDERKSAGLPRADAKRIKVTADNLEAVKKLIGE